MMRLGVRPVGGKISGNGIDLDLNPIRPFFDVAQPYVHSVEFFGQHLLPFNDEVQLVLKIF